MAVDTRPKDSYPFATANGEVIPLDIIRPRNLILKSFTATANSPFTITDTSAVATLIADNDCIVFFGEVPTEIEDNTSYPDALYVPKNTAVSTTVVAGINSVRGITGSGTLKIQTIEQWSGLALTTRYTGR